MLSFKGAHGYHITIYDTITQRSLALYIQQCNGIRIEEKYKDARSEILCKAVTSWPCQTIKTTIVIYKCNTVIPIGYSYYHVFIVADQRDEIMQRLTIPH